VVDARPAPVLVDSARRGVQSRPRCPGEEASARREVHVRQRDSAWSSFRSNLHLRTRRPAVSSPRKTPIGRFCIARRAGMTWARHTSRPTGRLCICGRAPTVHAATEGHLLPDRKVREPGTRASVNDAPAPRPKNLRLEQLRQADHGLAVGTKDWSSAASSN
jgi:hypothetical protein